MQQAKPGRGRHRRGRPGSIYVTNLVTVVRRGFFTSFFSHGRHSQTVPAPRYARRSVVMHA